MADEAAVKEFASKKMVAGILAIVIGSLGIHKFYLGFQKEGIIMLCITLCSLGFLSGISGIIGLIEGIMYLTKSDEDFYRLYKVEKKAWF
jgi:TM2 domain-containing membrane protein YozV